jgi:hypothetical protein
MTWGEFKKYVEEQGVKDDMEISYIDSNCGETNTTVEIKKQGPYGNNPGKTYVIIE